MKNGAENNFDQVFETIRKAKPERIATEKDAYLEKKFGYLSQEELKRKLTERFSEAVYAEEEKPYEEIAADLRRSGKIFLDVNGLKAINDFSSHKKGDAFLEKLMDTLKNNNIINAYIKEKGLQAEITREGGDEFSFLIKKTEGELYGKSGDEPEILIEFRKIIQEEIKKIDINDLIDFESPSVISKLDDNGRAMFERAKKESGGKFNFNISAAGGECTLAEVLDKYLEIRRTLKEHGDEPKRREQILNELMGLTQDLASVKMSKNKRINKSQLAEGSWSERFTAYLMMRTEESRELFQQIVSLKDEIKERDYKIEGLASQIVKKDLKLVELEEKIKDLESKLKKIQKNNFFDFEENK